MSKLVRAAISDPNGPKFTAEGSNSTAFSSQDREKILGYKERYEWREVSDKIKELSKYDKIPRRHLHSRFSLREIVGVHGGLQDFEQELMEIAQYYFEFGDDLKATVRDIGPSKPEPLIDVSVDKLAPFWEGRLDPDTIRWIHVPIGPGKLQDSLTERFVQTGDNIGKYTEIVHGERREIIQSEGKQYECEILNLRTLKVVQEAYNVLDLIRRWSKEDSASESKDFFQYGAREQSGTSWGRSLWRVNREQMAFEELAHAALPWHLGSGFPNGFRGVDLEAWPVDAKVVEQTLSYQHRFKDTILVKDPLRCVYRKGIILTFSPCRGISCIDRILNSELEKPPMRAGKDPETSVIPKVQHDFPTRGTQGWHSKTVEWFMVYLMIEVLITPLSSQLQRWRVKQTELQYVYQTIVWNLKRRCQTDPGGGRPTELALHYVACINELTELVSVFEDKKLALARLKEHCPATNDTFEVSNCGSNEESDLPSANQMIEEALTTLESIGQLLPGLRAEMESSLATFYHLRNIEQDVLQRLSERNNRTMLVFTATTIIFLPLSFFTSYFGMNLSDVTNTTHTQRYFWSVCGTIALVIVFGTFCYAMKERLIEGGGRFIQSIRAFLQRVRDYFRRMH